MIVLWGISFLCLVVSHKCDAQTSYNISIENGLSTNVMTTVIRDHKGYMWLGSYNGLHQHLGNNIRVYNKIGKDSLSLSGSEMNALYEDHRGHIWIGTTAGLDCLNPLSGLISHYKLKTSGTRPSHLGYIYSIFEDRQQNIWISADEALFCLNPVSGSYRAYYAGKADSCIPATPTGYRQGIGDERGFWLSTADGLAFYDYVTHSFRHKYNSREPVFTRNGNTNGSAASDICKDDSGNIYFVDGGKELVKYHLKTGQYTTFAFDRPAGSWNCCFSLATDYKGNVWIGFRHGGILLFNATDHSFTPIRKEMRSKLLQSNYVTEICQDYQHHMWVTSDQGIDVIDYYQQGLQQFQLSDAPDFTRLRHPAAIMSDDAKGHLYIPFMNGSLFVFDYLKDSIVETKLSADRSRITYMEPLDDGSAEIYYNGGSTRIRNPLQTEQLRRAQLQKPVNQADHHFAIWAQKVSGYTYLKYANATLDRIAEDGTVQHLDCNGFMKLSCISRDRRDIYFINPDDNLIRQHISNGQLTTYDLQRLLAIQGFALSNVRDLTDDGAGNIWITAQNGLVRYNIPRKELHVYNTSQGIAHNFTYSLLTDNKGIVWVCSFGGINWYDQVANAFRKAVQYKDGTYMDAFGSSIKTNDGTLYFLSGNKLTRIRPEIFLQSSLKNPRLLIHEIQVNGMQMAGEADPKLEKLTRHENKVSFHYGLLDYNMLISNVRLQYRLKGLETDWNEDEQTEVTYNSLQPGSYMFQLRTLSTDGKVLNCESVPFRIRPAFWQTWWARLLVLLAIAASIFLAVRKRIQSIKRKAYIKQQLTELESKALRAQMNPHFIFNSLNAIQELVIREDSTAAYQYLSKFSKLLRMVLLHSEHSLISLADELEMYQLYLSLEGLRFNHSFRYQIIVDEGLDTEELQIPPLLLQPYLENAIWHGLMHKKGEKVLEIHFAEENDFIVCTITDNGIGRAAAVALGVGKLRGRGDVSRGMSLSRHRIALLNKANSEQAGVIIEDLTDETRQSLGTKVVVTLSIHEMISEQGNDNNSTL